MSFKIGRNDLCPCGSGKKFKKCCVDKYNQAEAATPADGIKMSAVILDIIDEPLKFATGKKDIENLVTFACLAWNIAVMAESVSDSIDKIQNEYDGSNIPEEIQPLIHSMVKMKNEKYPHINRIIMDFNIIVKSMEDIIVQIKSSEFKK